MLIRELLPSLRFELYLPRNWLIVRPVFFTSTSISPAIVTSMFPKSPAWRTALLIDPWFTRFGLKWPPTIPQPAPALSKLPLWTWNPCSPTVSFIPRITPLNSTKPWLSSTLSFPVSSPLLPEMPCPNSHQAVSPSTVCSRVKRVNRKGAALVNILLRPCQTLDCRLFRPQLSTTAYHIMLHRCTNLEILIFFRSDLTWSFIWSGLVGYSCVQSSGLVWSDLKLKDPFGSYFIW